MEGGGEQKKTSLLRLLFARSKNVRETMRVVCYFFSLSPEKRRLFAFEKCYFRERFSHTGINITYARVVNFSPPTKVKSLLNTHLSAARDKNKRCVCVCVSI